MKELLITSSVLIIVILLARWIFRGRVSHTLIYGLWLLAALRLLIPVQLFRLDFSVLGSAAPLTEAITRIADRPVSGPTKEEVYTDIVRDCIENNPSAFLPEVQEQIKAEAAQSAAPEEILDKLLHSHPQQTLLTPEAQEQAEQQAAQAVTGPTLGQLAAGVWIAGMAGMAVWFAAVNLRHRRRIRRDTTPLPGTQSKVPVLVSESVGSPCLAGLFRPTVYLTPECAADPRSLDHVLTHELTHLRHWDHIWSVVRCVCLCVYWFDPLVWLAAALSRRDCELACDEGALRRLGEEERIAYGKTLLQTVSHAATPTHLLQTSTSMGETKRQLKQRINFIVNKPKVLLAAAIVLVLVCIAAAGCTFAGPVARAAEVIPAPSDPAPPAEQPVTVYLLTAAAHYSPSGQLKGCTEYTYDDHGRLTGKTYSSATYPDTSKYHTYAYDDHGNLILDECSIGQDTVYSLSYRYTYNPDGTVASYTSAQEGVEYFVAYDEMGRFQKLTYTDPGGQIQDAVLCHYSPDGQLLQINSCREGILWQYIYEYDENGRPVSLRYLIDNGEPMLLGQWDWQYRNLNVVNFQSPGENLTFYYENGRLIVISSRDGANPPAYVIDSLGNIAEARNEDGTGRRDVYTYQAVTLSAEDAARLPINDEYSRYCFVAAYRDNVLGLFLPRPLE